MAAETNVIPTAQRKKAREIDFVQRFTHDSLDKLTEVLGVTRRIPMMEGTTLYFYRTTGTLQNGAVTEGDIIPLSQYTTEKVAVGEITLKKWRKAVTAEAIKKSGYEAAVNDTDNALMKDVQAGVRSDLFPLSLINISEPTRRNPNSYAVLCFEKKTIRHMTDTASTQCR